MPLPATKYGIPFLVFVRASFVVRGANVPAILRALVACGWFGIETWIGGQAIYSMLRILWPASANFHGAAWFCFFLFWCVNRSAARLWFPPLENILSLAWPLKARAFFHDSGAKPPP